MLTGVGKSEGAVSICIRESYPPVYYAYTPPNPVRWKIGIGIGKSNRGSADKK